MKKIKQRNRVIDFIKRILNFFRLYLNEVFSKPYSKEEDNTDVYIFVIKYLYFKKIIPLYFRFITWITHYYPFSLLYKNKIFHASNIKAYKLINDMENVARNAKIPILIENGYQDWNICTFYGILFGVKTKKQVVVKKLQQLFQDKFGTVYVQEEKRGFRIVVDRNLV